MFVYPERRVADDESCYHYSLGFSLSRGTINLKNKNLGNDTGTVPVYRLKFSTVLKNFVRLTYSGVTEERNFMKFFKIFVCLFVLQLSFKNKNIFFASCLCLYLRESKSLCVGI